MQITTRLHRPRIASTELATDHITLLERIAEIRRIWTQPAREVRLTAIGYQPDESYTGCEIMHGVVCWYKVIRSIK